MTYMTGVIYFMLFFCFIDSFWRIYCALQFGKDLFLPILRIQTYQSPDEATRSDLSFQLPRQAKASTKLLPAHPHFATRKVRRVIWMWVKSLLPVKHVSRAPQWFFIAHIPQLWGPAQHGVKTTPGTQGAEWYEEPLRRWWPWSFVICRFAFVQSVVPWEMMSNFSLLLDFRFENRTW